MSAPLSQRATHPASTDGGDGSVDGDSGDEHAPTGWGRAWIWFKRIAPWALAAVVVVLLVRQGRSIDWHAAWVALKEQKSQNLAIAALLAAISHSLVASYDLVGRHETRHGLRWPRTIGIAAICYAFNLNLGSLVGALAMKIRLYTRSGVRLADAWRVIALSISTNWLGYLVAGGAVLALSPPPMPESWPLSAGVMRIVGIVMVVVASAYLVLALSRGRRRFTFHGHEMHLPGGRVALWQLAVSTTNWCLMGVIVWTLLEFRVDYAVVLGVLLLAAVAGVITHVPAGLGVFEAVFLFSLGDTMPQATLLGALLAYRAIYYLVPLVIAAAGYGISETAFRVTLRRERDTGD